jgi:hypothetical protein
MCVVNALIDAANGLVLLQNPARLALRMPNVTPLPQTWICITLVPTHRNFGIVVDGGSDDDDGVAVNQRAAEGLGGGAIAGIAIAGIATVMILLFLFAARKRASESREGQVKHVYMDEADDLGPFSPRSARIVGEDSSHSSGGTGYSPERSVNGSHILQDLNDFEDDHHCMGVELGLDGKARDVRRCASATCETCRQKRLRPMFIKGGNPPEPPPRLPLDARRVYAANDTVDL